MKKMLQFSKYDKVKNEVLPKASDGTVKIMWYLLTHDNYYTRLCTDGLEEIGVCVQQIADKAMAEGDFLSKPALEELTAAGCFYFENEKKWCMVSFVSRVILDTKKDKSWLIISEELLNKRELHRMARKFVEEIYADRFSEQKTEENN